MTASGIMGLCLIVLAVMLVIGIIKRVLKLVISAAVLMVLWWVFGPTLLTLFGIL